MAAFLKPKTMEESTDIKWMEKPEIDLSKVDNVIISDIYPFDAPDYVDAYIDSADYNGEPMTEEQLEVINDDLDFKAEKVHKYLY